MNAHSSTAGAALASRFSAARDTAVARPNHRAQVAGQGPFQPPAKPRAAPWTAAVLCRVALAVCNTKAPEDWRSLKDWRPVSGAVRLPPAGHPVTIAGGGRVCFRQDTFPTQGLPGTRAILCEHLDGTVSILKERPDQQKLPVMLFSNRPR